MCAVDYMNKREEIMLLQITYKRSQDDSLLGPVYRIQ